MDVRLIPFAANVDPRGTLTAIEDPTHVPFPIRRVFLVHDVDPATPRGGHAHRDTDQVILAAHGALNVRVTDGFEAESFRLDSPTFGLFVPRMLWVDLLDFSSDTVCLVLANTLYDQSRSIRSWDEYADVVGAVREPT